MTMANGFPGSRRGFLRTLGILGGAAVGTQVPLLSGNLQPGAAFSASTSTASPSVSAKIGLLLPVSERRTGLAAGFSAGFKLGFEQFRSEGGDARILWASAPGGTTAYQMLAGAKQLVEKDRVDLVVTIANPRSVPKLIPLFERAGTCLLVANAGENLVRATEFSSHTFYNTLGYWQSCYALGQQAVKDHGVRAYILASPYECGYDGLDAFRLGLAKAGGQEVGLGIVGKATPTQELVRMLADMELAQPDFVYVLQGGRDADSILSRGALVGMTKVAPMVASSFLSDGLTDVEAQQASTGLRSCLSWGQGISTEENRTFLHAIGQTGDLKPNAFTLLGFDTAKLVISALQAAESQSSRLASALEQASWSSPRGQLKMDTATHTPQVPLILRQARPGHGMVSENPVASLPVLNEASPEVRQLRQRTPVGYTDPYFPTY